MEPVPEELHVQALKIRRGEPGDTVSVRTLLRWFGSERRGFYVVHGIRQALEELQLATKPDFEFTWLDGPIEFYALEAQPEQENHLIHCPNPKSCALARL